TKSQFRPRVPGKGGATSYQLRQYAEATLGGGSLRKVVKLPEGEDENEWLAVNSAFDLGARYRDEWEMLTLARQWWTSTTRSTSSTAPSPSSARRSRVRR